MDTSGLLAAIDGRQPRHEAAARVVRAATEPLVLSPFVLAELEYLLATRVGQHAELALLGEVADGALDLAPFAEADLAEAREIIVAYGDLNLGLADASIVVLSRRHDVRDVLTLDERHFRALRGPRGTGFRLLPADAAG